MMIFQAAARRNNPTSSFKTAKMMHPMPSARREKSVLGATDTFRAGQMSFKVTNGDGEATQQHLQASLVFVCYM